MTDPESQRESTSHMNVPDVKDSANLPRAYTDFVRRVAPAFHIHAPKFVLGYTLSTIGDDGNYFQWAEYGFSPKGAQGEKTKYLTRLDWELSMKELPLSIRKRLTHLRPKIAALDWSHEADFRLAWKKWRTFNAFVLKETDAHPQLKEARQYASSMKKFIDEPWKQLIRGESYR